jgi:hypothetical protein
MFDVLPGELTLPLLQEMKHTVIIKAAKIQVLNSKGMLRQVWRFEVTAYLRTYIPVMHIKVYNQCRQ